MSEIIISDDGKNKIVRVNNFLVAFGINNACLQPINDDGSGPHDDDDDEDYEPTSKHYNELKEVTDAYCNRLLTTYCAKHAGVNFVKCVSTVASRSYGTKKIPNENFQVCIKYTNTDLYFTKDSDLTSELEVSAECLLMRALSTTKYLMEIRSICNGETPFRAAENVFFKHYGKNPCDV